MSAIRLLALILLCTILLGACDRSDLIRVRLLSPIGETKKDHAIYSDLTKVSTSKTTSANPKTSGGSLLFLFKSIGLGYTTLTTQIEKEARTTAGDDLILKEKTTLVTNFTDLAFGIGENYSFMWGAGVLTGGEQERYVAYTDKETKKLWVDNDLVGHSLFFALGHHGSGFETLLGYRMNFIKSKFDDSGTKIPSHMGKSPAIRKVVSYESSVIRLTTSQVQLGIGVTF